MGVVDRVDSLVQPICARFGAELIDVEYSGGLMRVVLDQPDGVGTEVLSEVTREISRILDYENPVPGRYTLEVTSPGLERKLKKVEHYERSIGKRISLKTKPGTEGGRRLEGLLDLVGDSTVTVCLDDGTTRVLSYEEIQSARTVFVWEQEPKSVRRDEGSSSGKRRMAS